MLRPRVVVCLDVKDGRVVKGTRFRDLRDVGDPVELARRYEREGADEVVFLDISASVEGRGTLLDTVRRTAEVLFIPLTVGGGVRTVDDMGRLLRAGADKVSVNTAAVADPDLLSRAERRFGAQCVVASVDGKREEDAPPSDRGDPGASRTRTWSGWRVYTHGGSRATALDAVVWAGRCARRGAGEILLTSVDRDGGRKGYDLAFVEAVADEVSVPVVASGGAGSSDHLRDAFRAGASAALVAGILHDELASVGGLKQDLEGWGVPVRPVAAAGRAS